MIYDLLFMIINQSYWGSPQKGHLHIGQAEHDMDNLRPVDVLSKGTAWSPQWSPNPQKRRRLKAILDSFHEVYYIII